MASGNLGRWVVVFAAMCGAGAIMAAEEDIRHDVGSNGDAENSKPVSVEVGRAAIKVGEPVVVELVRRFEKPQMAVSKTGETEPYSGVRHETWYKVSEGDSEMTWADFEELDGHATPLLPGTVALWDDEGLVYRGQFVVFYDHTEKKLPFNRPGRFTISIPVEGRNVHNIAVTVEAGSEPEKKAVGELTDANDFMFLEFGSCEEEARVGAMGRLGKVAKEYPEITLGKWCAARLGLEYFGEFVKEVGSLEKYMAKEEKDAADEALFERAYENLRRGAELYDEFPLREELIYRLATAELVRGDYEKAGSYIDELGVKYPRGKYGKRSAEFKKELRKMQRQGWGCDGGGVVESLTLGRAEG